ncbi:zinc finger ring-type [Stylonychia lemnae]|uniref:RING-type E3 ubiquitin transferase n=1 Tax=Stylonychia lemnae TaxID=5949 RepID=A0A077ZXD8_STYLE|nr:zinc finger ring-type [Stylonychia lemnae]|eukprot:CDW73216.1 zinc finger ring-type [Stylonychia lemnae]
MGNANRNVILFFKTYQIPQSFIIGYLPNVPAAGRPNEVKSGDNQFYLDMKFDAIYECEITVFICTQECRNASNIPLYPDQPNPHSYKFSKGLRQQFPPSISNINVNEYRLEDLINTKGDYYPIVIMIESRYPQDYSGRAKRSIQYTYGCFTQETPGLLKYKFLNQKFLYNNVIFDMSDIFGIDNAAANIADEAQKECVICYTTTKDTVVLPCRHMCLCIQCSQIVRMQTNKCPICRTQVSSFMQIKIEGKKQNADDSSHKLLPSSNIE